MKLLTLNPLLSESFKQKMLLNEWSISHQDAGQTHLVGWGYEITWQKGGSSVTLRYFDKQGIAEAFLEVTQEAVDEMQQLLSNLSATHD
ncbi:hypothetical protein MNBD_GAMMA04-1087 [hydrothermal vent metagenome]|uniref:Uncharacterized protein n=1 Tax=hydrothermal vent metagenome TaxID=652676 RepID=A0A3B0WRG4_9ZZZZ